MSDDDDCSSMGGGHNGRMPDYLTDRPSNACVRCRRRKQKCDGGPDCTRCRKAGAVCEMRVKTKPTGLCGKCKGVAKENPESILEELGVDPETGAIVAYGTSSKTLPMVSITTDYFATRALNNSSLNRCMAFINNNTLPAFPETSFRTYMAMPFWKHLTETTAFEIQQKAEGQVEDDTGLGMLLSAFEHAVYFTHGLVGVSDHANATLMASKAMALRDVLFRKDSPIIKRTDLADQMITALAIFSNSLLLAGDYVEFFHSSKLLAVMFLHWKDHLSHDVTAMVDTARCATATVYHVHMEKGPEALPPCAPHVHTRNRISDLRNELAKVIYKMSAVVYYDIRAGGAEAGSPGVFDFYHFRPLTITNTRQHAEEIRARLERYAVPLLKAEEACPSVNPTFLRALKVQVYGIMGLAQYRVGLTDEGVASSKTCVQEVTLLYDPPPMCFSPFSYALKVLLDTNNIPEFIRGAELLSRFKDRRAAAMAPSIQAAALQTSGKADETMEGETGVTFASLPFSRIMRRPAGQPQPIDGPGLMGLERHATPEGSDQSNTVDHEEDARAKASTIAAVTAIVGPAPAWPGGKVGPSTAVLQSWPPYLQEEQGTHSHLASRTVSVTVSSGGTSSGRASAISEFHEVEGPGDAAYGQHEYEGHHMDGGGGYHGGDGGDGGDLLAMIEQAASGPYRAVSPDLGAAAAAAAAADSLMDQVVPLELYTDQLDPEWIRDGGFLFSPTAAN